MIDNLPLYNTLAEMLLHLEATQENSNALNYRQEEKWYSISTSEFLRMVRHFAAGLASMGVKRGDTVGILAPSSPFWVVFDLGIMLAGGVSVPLFPNVSEKNFQYQVTHSGLKTIIVSGEEQCAMFNRHTEYFENSITLGLPEQRSKTIDFHDVLKKGERFLETQPSFLQDMTNSIHRDDLWTIMYTSGTSGVPKGVELTQKNIIHQLTACKDSFPFEEDERFLAVLPLAHVMGRMQALVMVSLSVSTYFVDDIQNVATLCQEINPTAINVVPRLLEKVYGKMLSRLQSAGIMKKTIGNWAFELAQTREHSWLQRLLHPVANTMVYSTLREALGGQLRFVISGSAPLDPSLCEFFINIGVPIYEGYGLTETCPALTLNVPEHRKVGTVGQAIPGVEIALSRYGEVLARGDNVMRGYHKNPEATREAIDEEGWFHTGDKGYIDEEGYLAIRGRIKELLKTSGGKYVSPIPIEQGIMKAPLIDLALVIAEGRRFTTCLIFVDIAVAESLRSNMDMDNLSLEDFLQTPAVREKFEEHISKVNEDLNNWEKVKKYALLTDVLSIDAGEITPTLKIRRAVIVEKYKDVIDSLYEGEEGMVAEKEPAFTPGG